jgi:hypothetical protein
MVRAYVDNLFDYYDADGSGGLDQSEMSFLLNDICFEYKFPPMSDDQVSTIIQKYDTDGNGIFDREELFAIVAPMFAEGPKQKNLSAFDKETLTPSEAIKKLSQITTTLFENRHRFIPDLNSILAQKKTYQVYQNRNHHCKNAVLDSFAAQFLGTEGADSLVRNSETASRDFQEDLPKIK